MSSKVARFRVEPICAVLQVAPSTYCAAKNRAPSARAVSEAVVTPELMTIWENSHRVYGVRKLWKAARRAGIDIGRDQTGRLMRAAGIEGATRSTRVETTRADPAASRHPDLVHRESSAPGPKRLWVTDLTFVPTWAESSVSASSSTFSPGWAGGAPLTCAPRWSWTRSRWLAGAAAPTMRTCVPQRGRQST